MVSYIAARDGRARTIKVAAFWRDKRGVTAVVFAILHQSFSNESPLIAFRRITLRPKWVAKVDLE
jgi:hypothetical protein